MMVNGTEELKAHIEAVTQKAEETEEEFVSDDDDQATLIYNDLLQALEWLKKCGLLLDYLAEPIISHDITKRERAAMTRLSDGIGKFVEEVETSYSTDE